MKTTLRYAAFAVLLFIAALPEQAHAKSNAITATAKKSAPKTYKVCFHENGGIGKMSTQKYTVNKAAKLPANRYTRKGFIFIGWSKSKTGAVTLQNGQSVKNLAPGGKTVTLYAQWAVPNYKVVFDKNGGAGSMPAQTHVYGKAANLTANRFTRNGYSFGGWATTPTGNLKFKDKESVKNLTRAGRTITLYALWKANPAQQSKPAAATSTSATPATSTTSKPAATTLSPSGTSSSPALPGDEVVFSQLQWVYGGFNGASAKISGKARINNLKASNSGVTYSWASGSCQDIGASSASDASCIACLFCYSGGKWSGGKFDWICTNNKSPTFTNIIDKYKSWSSGVLSKAEEYAFVILSKDGKSRTNVIRVKSPGFSTTATAPAATTSSTTTSTSADEVNFSLLQWTWGGFKGGSAKLASQPRISGLKVSSGGMSYSWKSGGCENLGSSSATDASCVACLFCYSGGKWVGGKFDWISTSRRTRDFKNINEGYNGWSAATFSRAEAYAFVIVSKDGKTRSNVILCKK